MTKVGRPHSYTKALGDEICTKLSTSEYGIAKLIKENPHWPHKQTIFEWRINVPEFGDSYAKAKQNQIEVWIDQVVDIADNTSNDTYINESGKEVCNSEWINRSRLRIDTRKWIAAKLAPKIYGERTSQDVTVSMRQEDALTSLE